MDCQFAPPHPDDQSLRRMRKIRCFFFKKQLFKKDFKVIIISKT